MIDHSQLHAAVTILKQGGIIAYPTEGVYGLGCDPFNALAVTQLCALKQRELSKGLILIASDWKQVSHLTMPIDNTTLKKILAQWPSPNTWIFPASKQAPAWICGHHDSIALRISKHPLVHALCQTYGHAVVSTSANPSRAPAARHATEVQNYFGEQVDLIMTAEVGNLSGPTPIWNAISGQRLR